MLRPEIWYREELVVLRNLVVASIKATSTDDVVSMTSLGYLFDKLEASIKTAPSAVTKEGSS